MRIIIFYMLFITLGNAIDLSERKDVQRIDVVEGNTLTLTCSAKPKNLRSYRWVYIREGAKPRVLSSGRRLVVGETRLSIEALPTPDNVNLILRLKEIRPYEAGLFMCWRHGLKPDPQIFVRVLDPGTEAEEPLSVEISAPEFVNYGGSVQIKCLIRPSWPGEVTWYKDGLTINPLDPVFSEYLEENADGELLATLKIVSVRQRANYTCYVPSATPVEETISIGVRVAQIESLRLEPSEDDIDYGEMLTISCVASGTDSKIIWLKDGNNLEVDETGHTLRKDAVLSDGRKESRLVIEPFSMGENGQYVCYVPGDSKGVLINIEGRAPKIIDVIGWDFYIGDVLRLTCSTQYMKSGKNVTWKFEGELLRKDWWGEHTTREDIHNITYHDLSLPVPTRNHAGLYTCETLHDSLSTTVNEIIPLYIEESSQTKINISIGDRMVLSCGIRGYPAPSVSWERNFNGQWKTIEEIMSENNKTKLEDILTSREPLYDDEGVIGEKLNLIVEEAFPEHSGTYKCKGYNNKEEVTLETEVNVSEKVVKILDVAADEVMEGETLEIKCIISNWGEQVEFIHGLRVLGKDDSDKYIVELTSEEVRKKERQLKGGKTLTVEDVIYTYVLYIDDVSLDDQGFYECHAGPGIVKSVVVRVNQIPPEVVEMAASPAVEGGEFFVSCTITNMPTEEQAMFYFEGNALNQAEDTRYSVHLAELTDEVVIDSKGRAKLATYVLKVLNAVPEDSGTYNCTVGDLAEGSVDISIKDLESIEEINLKSFPVFEGEELIINCTVSNSEKEVTFFHNQTVLIGDEPPRINLSRTSDRNSTVHSLSISNATIQDSGLYQCFTSPVISAETNVTITVREQLKFFEFPESSIKVVLESDLKLECAASGNSVPQVTWRKEETTEPLINSSGLATLNFVNFSVSDAGKYICEAETADEIISTKANLEVMPELKIIEIPDAEISVAEDSSAVLRCMVLSSLPSENPLVTWHKGGTEDILASGYEIASYEIQNAKPTDQGEYICKAAIPGLEKMATTQVEVIPFKKNEPEAYASTTPKPALEPGKLIELIGPESVNENEDIMLTCILSPLFAYYKNVVQFNGTILTYDNKLVFPDPRFNVTLTKGVHEEMILNLGIQRVTPSDQGIYECTVNTDPVTRNTHFVRVVPLASEPSVGDAELEGTTSVPGPGFWDDDFPFVFSDVLSPKSFSTETPTTEKHLTDTIPDYDTNIMSHIVKVKPGESAFLECSLPDDQLPIIWEREEGSILLSVDLLKILDSPKYEIDAPDPATRNLFIHGTDASDSGLYTCLKQDLDPQLYVHIEVVVEEVLTDDSVGEQLSTIPPDALEGFTDFPTLEQPTTPISVEVSVIDDYNTELSFTEEQNHFKAVNITEQISADMDEEIEEYDLGILELPKEEEAQNVSTSDGTFHYNITDTVDQVAVLDTNVFNATYGTADIYEITTTSDDLYRGTELYSINPATSVVPPNSSSDTGTEDEVTGEISEIQSYEDMSEYDNNEEAETSSGIAETNIYYHVNHTYSDEDETEDKFKENENETVIQSIPDAITTSKTDENSEIESSDAEFHEETTVASENFSTVTPALTSEDSEEHSKSDDISSSSDYEYSYEDSLESTEAANKDFPVIVAEPGVDLAVPPEAEVILPCPTDAVADDITWEDSEKVLFLGSLDLSGDESVSLSLDGSLRLLSGTTDSKNTKVYSCLVYDHISNEDVPVASYSVDLIESDTVEKLQNVKVEEYFVNSGENSKGAPDVGYGNVGPDKPSLLLLEFLNVSELQEHEVAVLSNDEMSGQSLTHILRNQGLNAIFVEEHKCLKSEEISGWEEVLKSLKLCEGEARNASFLRESQPAFFIMDFGVSLGASQLYASNLLYINNVPHNMSAHIFGPLVPMMFISSDQNTNAGIQCGSRKHSSTIEEYDKKSSVCKSSLASTLVTLQETYLSLSLSIKHSGP